MCPATKNTILGIIFDMDGVLCDSEPFICEAGRKMLAERYRLAVKPEDFAPFVGTGEDSFLSGPARKYGVQIKLPEDKERTYEIYLEIIKGKLKPLAGVKEFIAECRAKKMKHPAVPTRKGRDGAAYSAEAKLLAAKAGSLRNSPKPQPSFANATLRSQRRLPSLRSTRASEGPVACHGDEGKENIRRRRIKLAVATSADRVKMNGNLVEIGIPPESFDALVCGDEVNRKKPNPDIFLLAARKLRLPPESCLVIEDAPSGLQAAKAAGMRALGLTTSFKADVLKSAGADWTAPDLNHWQ